MARYIGKVPLLPGSLQIGGGIKLNCEVEEPNKTKEEEERYSMAKDQPDTPADIMEILKAAAEKYLADDKKKAPTKKRIKPAVANKGVKRMKTTKGQGTIPLLD